jgi:hypothetical protein
MRKIVTYTTINNETKTLELQQSVRVGKEQPIMQFSSNNIIV